MGAERRRGWLALALLLLAGGAVLAGQARLAQGPPAAHFAPLVPLLSRMDLDGDGQVSAAEAAALSRPGEPSWDLDADGELEPAELEATLRRVDPLWTQRAPALGAASR
ncbi:MAG: hypothetical protein JNM72_11820 [Deltaproteobacteria bacterium]|jgi:hypothetical protein|nr:hypothetical protein [Deltaproteobacteria bacterium]